VLRAEFACERADYFTNFEVRKHGKDTLSKNAEHGSAVKSKISLIQILQVLQGCP